MFSNGLKVQHRSTKAAKRTLVFSILACIVFITYLTLTGAPPVPTTHIVQSAPGSLPLAFIPNQGQVQSEVLYQAYDMNTAFFLTASDLVFTRSAAGQADQSVVRISHENTQAGVAVSGINLLKGQVNYLLGSDSSKWVTHLPTYASVLFSGLYPGIDMTYDGMQGAFESTYYVKPGADPTAIRWTISGNVVARLNTETGSIELYDAAAKSGQPVLVEQAPIIYQEINGKQVIVPSRFAQNADGSFSYAISAYDPAKTLVIDPTLVYSSYFGGGQLDSADGMALDADGNIYVAGMTSSTDFPVKNAQQLKNKGSDDIFIMKLNPTGSEMIYSTYLGGTDDEEANGVSVDASGSVYLAGDTTSADFPVKNAYAAKCAQTMFDVCIPDAFLAKLSADGSQLLYSTYLGGMEPDTAQGVVAGASGHAYLTGQTFSSDFPTKTAAQAKFGGESDAFVTDIDTSAAGAASLAWSTFLGGKSVDLGAAIGMSGTQLVITGQTTSSDFPTKSPLQAFKGSQDAFITGLTDAGAVRYSTYLGGSDQDTAYGVTVNAQGAYVTGTTLSTDFPTLTPIQDKNKGGNDAFVTGIAADGSAWKFSTYLGGTGADYGYAITVNAAGALYLTGSTTSADFPLLNTLQAYTGNGDAFVAKIKPAGNALDFATLLGGSESETGVGIAVDTKDNVYVAGNTFSANLPLEKALGTKYAGSGDVFVSILTDDGTINPPPDETPVVDPTIVVPNLDALNPLFGSFKIASSVVLAPGEELTFTILLHNSSMEEVTASVVDKMPAGLDYKAASAKPAGTYDATKRTITWTSVKVPAEGETRLTFVSTTTVTDPKLVINTASITAADQTFDRFFVVKVGAHPKTDAQRPTINKFWIGDQDVLTSQDVTLHLQAQDNGKVEKMYIREWQVAQKPLPHWELVKSSGWVDYAETYNWKLGPQSGVHYVAAVVADELHNLSILNKDAIDFASLVLPDTKLEANGLIPYLVSYDANTPVKATLAPSEGSPMLFVWYPGNILVPNKISVNGQVEFTTPKAGTYYFLVYSAANTTFDLQITPGGGPTRYAMTSAVTGPLSVTGAQTTTIQSDPLLSKIGFDPFTAGPGSIPAPDDEPTNRIYLPSIGNR